jgi:hypothetical protein
MPAVNPNTLTTTRIPNAYVIGGASNPGGTENVLRPVDNSSNPCKIVIGPKKGFQYIKAENWRAGLTPFDNGYYNDGISDGHDPSPFPAAPSRYYDSNYPSVLFEWWNNYVIYCNSGNSEGPNGIDNLEVFVVDDSTALINLTNSLLSVSTTDEFGALSAIANSAEFLCTNTHYPDIPLHDYVGINGATYSLKLLLDFGFIPSYPRGGQYSYDISNSSNSHNMIFTSTSYIIYESEGTSGLDCSGGCLKFDNYDSVDYGYIPYQPDLYPLNTTVNTWVKVQSTSSNRCIIDTTNGWNGSGPGTGYQLWINGTQVTIFVLTSVSVFTWTSNVSLISANVWYNIAFTISPDPGNTITNVEVIVSDYSQYYLDGFNGIEPGGQGGNTNDFVIGVKKSTPATNPFNSRISLVSVYEGALNGNDIAKLWTAYTQCNPKPDNPSGFVGRYANY